jgi:thiol:disulfide interchange protein
MMPLQSATRRLFFAAALLVMLSLSAPSDLRAQAGLFRPDPHLYSDTANPATDISAAIARATREHKRILLDFGGNWCGDCQILDIYYHQSPNAEILAQHYLLVHISIGDSTLNKNRDIARKYKVPVERGVPALAVLDSHGRLLYSEHEKEFEHSSPSAITAFLNHWKA